MVQDKREAMARRDLTYGRAMALKECGGFVSRASTLLPQLRALDEGGGLFDDGDGDGLLRHGQLRAHEGPVRFGVELIEAFAPVVTGGGVSVRMHHPSSDDRC